MILLQYQSHSILANGLEPDELGSTPSVSTSAENAEGDTEPKPEKSKVVSPKKHSKHHKRHVKKKEKWGLLSPYLDTSELTNSSAEPLVIHYEYKSRITANRVVEPYLSYKMDHILPDLLVQEIESWNKKPSVSHKRGKIHSKHMAVSSLPKEKRHQRLKKKKHSFDEENKHDYFETRKDFFNLHLEVLKSENPFFQTTMKTALLSYMGMSKGAVAAIKELTDYYCH
ncbi:uncharacterized protein LOC119971263 isoform X2 [Scyliorhinus canicula]|uniref:uncharacterized protein LOC119971263 isoform X2 n=1 Tax=Scyliorhinus canicula TaxID=7830 RepID=UPI0018F6EA7C|nr:uncharacterized protein LOC119971263 isoform X2 [Scyliorhinus canicula]